MRKATHQHTRDHNTRLVFSTIYHEGDISRAEIARRTRLTRPTVSRIVSRLIQERFVVETGRGPSAGGKPPTLLDVAVDAHHLLALDLGSQAFRGAVVNLRGDIIARQTYPSNQQRGEEALALVKQVIDSLRQSTGAPILGIGIGSPGLTNPLDGVVREAVNLGWAGLPLRQILQARYKWPVYVANDSHLAALGEFIFGDAPAAGNLVVIKIGQGVGAGIVLDGQPYYGDNFGAGEIGHVVVDEGGALCSCGNRGCLETIASTRAILRLARDASGNADMTWGQLVAAEGEGQTWAKAAVQRAGRFLGVAIAGLVATLNVSRIVIAGRAAELGQSLLDAAVDEASQWALPSMVAETEITYSKLGSDVVILGSSAMVLQHELGIV